MNNDPQIEALDWAIKCARKVMVPASLPATMEHSAKIENLTSLRDSLAIRAERLKQLEAENLDLRAFDEGHQDARHALVEAIRPFYDCLGDTSKLSWKNWDDLWKAFRCEVGIPKSVVDFQKIHDQMQSKQKAVPADFGGKQ
jgi:hypothetical protein